jgi:hypothetical protein
MMIVINSDKRPISGTLVYSYADRAFDTKDRMVTGYSALQINSLQIVLDESGTLLYGWGYAPFEGWKEAKLEIPKSNDAALVYGGNLPVPGSSLRITEEEFLPVHFDKSKNLVCIGDYKNQATGIRFAPGMTAVLQEGDIVALWLAFKP